MTTELSGSPVTGGQRPVQGHAAYWSIGPEQLLSDLHATPDGLVPSDAERRLKQYASVDV
jgi:hypothetical protein